MSLIMSIFIDKQLDERARLVFKDLLDAATEKTLETHTKARLFSIDAFSMCSLSMVYVLVSS